MPVSVPDINLIVLLPEILISLLAMGLLLMSAWLPKGEQGIIGTFAISGVALIALILLGFIGAPVSTTFGGLFVDDLFARFMKVLLLTATVGPLLISLDFLPKNDLENGEYHVLTLFAMLGGMIMVSSGSFLMLYLGLELMSLSIYVLAAYRRDHAQSSEAGLKYFVLGSMASGILLYGISLIYGATGSTLYGAVGEHLSGAHLAPIAALGVVMVIAGVAFKLAAAPFHMWAPDVYEGAPTSVTAFMAVMPKVAALAVLYRVLLVAFGSLHHQWGPLLQFLAVLSLAVGALAAIVQTNIKRMLAYSAIGHVGFILLGMSAGSASGYQSVLVYLAIYIFMNLGAFAIIMTLGGEGIGEEIDDYKGLAHKRPILAVVMAIFMFSMAGIPPLAGFIGKLYIFMAAIKAGMIGLAIVGVLFAAIGAFYYLRIVKLMYFDEPQSAFAMPLSLPCRTVLAVSTLLVLVWGIFPGHLLSWTQASIQSFL